MSSRHICQYRYYSGRGNAEFQSRYQDFVSRIHLSSGGTFRNLMGTLLRRRPGSIPIETYLARRLCLSLYKMRRLQIGGYVRTVLLSIANVLPRQVKRDSICTSALSILLSYLSLDIMLLHPISHRHPCDSQLSSGFRDVASGRVQGPS